MSSAHTPIAAHRTSRAAQARLPPGERTGSHPAEAAIAAAAGAPAEALHRGRTRGCQTPQLHRGTHLLRSDLEEWLPGTWAPRAPHHHPAGHQASPRWSITAYAVCGG